MANSVAIESTAIPIKK